MNAFIRRASAGDQPSIRALVRKTGINPLHIHWRNFIVAEKRDKIIACGQLRPHQDGSAELASLAVSPVLQGMGIGRALVRTLIQIGPPELYLMCDAKMRPYYERFGFYRVTTAELPVEMRTLFRIGLAATWVLRKVTCEPVGVLAMRRLAQKEHPPHVVGRV